MFSKLLKVTSKQETRGGAQTQTVRCCLPGPRPVLGGSHRPADQGVWFDPNLHGVCLTSESPNIKEMQYSREEFSVVFGAVKEPLPMPPQCCGSI